MLKIEFYSVAKKSMKKINSIDRKMLFSACDKLIYDPIPSDAKRLVGKKGSFFRIRIGKYRVIYTILYELNFVAIAKIDKRNRVYKKS